MAEKKKITQAATKAEDLEIDKNNGTGDEKTGTASDGPAKDPETPEESGTASDSGTEEAAAESASEKAEAGEDSSSEPKASENGPGESGENPEEASGEAEDKEKKSFFKKKEKKDPKDEKIAELTDYLQRQMAEFDNYRKRTDKEKAQMFDMGAKSVIEKILPVVDNFERGLENSDEADPFVDGMNKIYKQLTKTLTDLGVEPIEAVGQEFNPDLHNAVMHTDDESVGENTVVEEFRKGYRYKDAVVRHSMVKVAN
ncbi:MAG: nucleotide exchange factor GrpE [Bilifractor sp.]